MPGILSGQPDCAVQAKRGQRCLQVHTKRIRTDRLLQELERKYEPNTYSVEMKHNVFYIYLDIESDTEAQPEATGRITSFA